MPREEHRIMREGVAVAYMEQAGKLLTLPQAREILSSTEPFGTHTFNREHKVKFDLQPGWADNIDAKQGTDTVDASVKIGAQEYQLTKDSLLEATSLIGITKKYTVQTPANLMVPHLNYWYGPSGRWDKELKVLTMGERVHAFTQGSIVPFSNLRFLDILEEQVQASLGDRPVYVDYKLNHDLRRTDMRLVIPQVEHEIEGRPNDVWCGGINFTNSLAGEIPTAVDGYLFRWICTNGAISYKNGAGKWNRRRGGQGEEVFEWCRHAVDDILQGFEHEFVALDEMAHTPIDGEVNDVLANLFEEYRVPLAARTPIIEEMVESDDLTMYGVLNAFTRAANHDDLSPQGRAALMAIGGDMPARVHRCEACHRVIRED